ncbi:hypothetical protein JTB14_035153 [Gonioctena quinquepunctata]|nr:hypothetical protein JTB14_035153 [Gonioctena quinquepunctata]
MTAGNKGVSPLQRAQWVCNTIFHQVIAVVTAFIFAVFFNNFEISNSRLWHIFLSTCAFVPLMAEGVILLSESNVWTLRLDRIKKAYLHGTLLGISTIALSVGIIFEVVAKDGRDEEHFVSGHAITGLISWILAMVSVLIGLFAAYAHNLKNFIKPVILKFVHNSVGIICYAVGITSLSLGLYIWGFASFVTDNDQQATVGLVGIIAIWTLWYKYNGSEISERRLQINEVEEKADITEDRKDEERKQIEIKKCKY